MKQDLLLLEQPALLATASSSSSSLTAAAATVETKQRSILCTTTKNVHSRPRAGHCRVHFDLKQNQTYAMIASSADDQTNDDASTTTTTSSWYRPHELWHMRQAVLQQATEGVHYLHDLVHVYRTYREYCMPPTAVSQQQHDDDDDEDDDPPFFHQPLYVDERFWGLESMHPTIQQDYMVRRQHLVQQIQQFQQQQQQSNNNNTTNYDERCTAIAQTSAWTSGASRMYARCIAHAVASAVRLDYHDNDEDDDDEDLTWLYSDESSSSFF